LDLIPELTCGTGIQVNEPSEIPIGMHIAVHRRDIAAAESAAPNTTFGQIALQAVCGELIARK
jgi:hypothetical protein